MIILELNTLARDDKQNVRLLLEVFCGQLEFADRGPRRVDASQLAHQRRAQVAHTVDTGAGGQLLAGVLPNFPAFGIRLFRRLAFRLGGTGISGRAIVACSIGKPRRDSLQETHTCTRQ